MKKTFVIGIKVKGRVVNYAVDAHNHAEAVKLARQQAMRDNPRK